MTDDVADRGKTFDALCASDPDPWNFETSPYECDKRVATVAALRGARVCEGTRNRLRHRRADPNLGSPLRNIAKARRI